MNSPIHVSLACLLVALCLACGPAEKPAERMSIPHTRYTLDNGLDVILHQDNSDPIVAVSILVHAGSNRERPGKTGFAHFFEHMSFNDSENVPQGANRKMIDELGGTRNGGTWSDGTIYYEVVPKDAFERLLWIDSDRMGFMINTVTEWALENEKQVVKNEKRQSVDNRAYGHTGQVLRANLYPPDHPYHWTVIGSLDDLQNATLDDVRAFYDRFYGPNNATLVIAGDIDIEQTKALVKKWFGEIPGGPAVEPLPAMPVELEATRSLYHVDNFAKLPELRMTFPTVEQFHDEQYALDALASILADGKRAHLYKVLVEERKLAPAASASHSADELAGTFSIRVRANAGTDLDEVKAAVDEALRRFDEDGFSTKDLDRIKASQETEFYDGISSVLGKAFQLALYNEFAGDPDYLGEEIERIQAVTPEQVVAAFERYVKGKPYVMTSFVPQGAEEQIVEGAERAAIVEEKIVQGAETTLAADPDFEYPRTETSFDRSTPPALGPAPLVRAPAVWEARTANGIRVLGIEHRELPLVEFDLRIRGGLLLDAADQPGVADLLAQLLNEGTKQRTPEQLEDAIGQLGASIAVRSGRESVTVSATTLTRNYAAVIALVEEMLLEPRWDAAEFERLKQSQLTRIRQREGDPRALGSAVFNRLVYGEKHPLSRPVEGTLESVSAITLDDLRGYYRRNLAPSLAAFHVAGDVDRETVLSSLAGLGSRWEAKKVEWPEFEIAQPLERPAVYFVDIPGAKQSVIYIGRIALSGGDPDYDPLNFANNRLGAGSSARLFQVLRIQKGYTYGAASYIPRRLEPAPFTATSSVRSNVTLESLRIFREQIRDYAKTFGRSELETTKQLLLKSATREFETLGDLRGVLSRISSFDLPLDYVEREQAARMKMSLEEVHRLIGEYMDESGMNYVIVGDAATQRAQVAKLGYGEPTTLDPGELW